MSVQLFHKVGRYYKPWGNAERWDFDGDVMTAGQFRLVHCVEDGSRRYSYDVTPDTAALAAAADVAAVAMERAIQAAAIARPGVDLSQYTKKQLAIIERFRAEMAEAGGLLPSHWQHASAREIAEAGIKALRAAAQNTRAGESNANGS